MIIHLRFHHCGLYKRNVNNRLLKAPVIIFFLYPPARASDISVITSPCLEDTFCHVLFHLSSGWSSAGHWNHLGTITEIFWHCVLIELEGSDWPISNSFIKSGRLEEILFVKELFCACKIYYKHSEGREDRKASKLGKIPVALE